MKHPNSNSAVAGFTLTEFLIVSLIMGILAAIVAPNWFQFLNWMRLKDDGANVRHVLEEARMASLSSKRRVNCFASYDGVEGAISCRYAHELISIAHYTGNFNLVHVNSCKDSLPGVSAWSEGEYAVPIAGYEFGAIAPDINGYYHTYTVALSRPSVNRCWSVGHDTIIGAPFSRELK